MTAKAPTAPAKGPDHAEHDHTGHDHSAGGHDHAAGGDHSGHDHAGHAHTPAVTPQNERVVATGFILTASFMFAEVIGGLMSGSLALIADAGHMLTDAAALALAWAAFRFGRRVADSKRSFGYLRFEVLAGFFNAVALLLLTAWITYEAISRLMEPSPVLAGPMFIVAVIGLIVNIVVFWMLTKGDKDHVNIKGAMLHVLGDLLGSVAAISASIIIYFTGWTPIDPILSVFLSAMILRAGWSLLQNSIHILMEGAPAGIEPDEVRDTLVKNVPGLTDVAHLHVWSITSGRVTATMDITVAPGSDPAAVVARLKEQLSDKYKIEHSTVEIDWSGLLVDCRLAETGPPAGAHAGHSH